MAFCPDCGRRLGQGDRFCAWCGAPVALTVQPAHYAVLTPVLSMPFLDTRAESKSATGRHTLGTASFVTGVLSFMLTLLLGSIAFAAHAELRTTAAAGITVLLFAFTAVVGIGLGTASLLQRRTGKASAILGIAFSLLTIGVAIALMAGLAVWLEDNTNPPFPAYVFAATVIGFR